MTRPINLDSLPLAGGYWAKSAGGTRRWVKMPDAKKRPMRRPQEETHVPALIFPGRPSCACGCLLAYPGEDCPNCRYQLTEAVA